MELRIYLKNSNTPNKHTLNAQISFFTQFLLIVFLQILAVGDVGACYRSGYSDQSEAIIVIHVFEEHEVHDNAGNRAGLA